MKEFRLILSAPASAARNMLLDKLIFERYLEENVPVLRLYGWEAPSFTYGISQEPQSLLDLGLCRSDGVGVAQRMTGGGVLFHNDELTYSFVCSKGDAAEPAGVLVSYRGLCSFLIRFYASLGLAAEFALESADFASRRAPSSLCSASHEKYDIVINNRKIGGNAQKRSRLAIFQHGSIPLSVDWNLARKYARTLPENIAETATSLSAELKDAPERRTLEEALVSAFAREFRADPVEEKEELYEAQLAQ